MKGLIYYLLTVVVAMSAMAENKTMFVHYDGNVDAIFFSEIDSIRYSDVGIDGAGSNQTHVQEIWTRDSVYRYEIAVIDSVTFQSPDNLAKPGTIDLAESLKDYVIGGGLSEGPVIWLSVNTPSGLMPEKGECLYQMGRSDILPSGFAGRVISTERDADGWLVRCEPVEFYDIFDQLAWVGENEFTLDEDCTEIKTKDDENVETVRRESLALPAFASRINYPPGGVVKMDDELRDIPMGPELARIEGEISVAPRVSCISGAYVLNLSDGSVKKGRRIKTDVTVDVKGKVRGRFNVGKKHTVAASKKGISVTLPMGFGQDYKMTYKGSMTLEGKMGLEYSFEAGYKTSAITSVNYDERISVPDATMKYTHDVVKKEERVVDASMDGSVSLTGTLSFSIVQSGDSLKSISNVHTYGSSLNGDALFLTSQIAGASINDSLYQAVTATGVTAKSVESVTASMKYSGSSFKLKGKITPSAVDTFYVVPKFSNPSWDNSAKRMTYKVQGVPMASSRSPLGVAVRSANDDVFRLTQSDKVWPYDCRAMFTCAVEYDPDTNDKVYPTATMPGGERILAAPAYPSVTNGLYPTISVQEVKGVRVTSGIPIIGSAADGKTSLHIGNFLPFKMDKK